MEQQEHQKLQPQSALGQLMAATVETAATPTASRRAGPRRLRPQVAPPPPPRWRVALTRVLAKLRTRRSWVAVMFVIGTVDVVLNLVNYVQLSADELNYGLVIGPPTHTGTRSVQIGLVRTSNFERQPLCGTYNSNQFPRTFLAFVVYLLCHWTTHVEVSTSRGAKLCLRCGTVVKPCSCFVSGQYYLLVGVGLLS